MINIKDFLIVFLLALLACVKVTFQGKACRKYVSSSGENVFFNALLFFSIALFTFLFFGIEKVGISVLAPAFATGLCMVLFQCGYSLALTCGPVSVTVLIVNLNILITTVVSIIMFKEKVYLTQIFGIAFLLGAMFLCVNKDERGAKKTKKWILYTLTAFFASGISSSIQKIFGASAVKNSNSSFLFYVYLFGAVMLSAVYTAGGIKNKESREKGKKKYGGILFYTALIGIVLCIYQQIYMYATGVIDGIFMFPAYSGMQSLMMSFIGVLFFKDRLSARQKASVLCGIVSVVLMNIKFIYLF